MSQTVRRLLLVIPLTLDDQGSEVRDASVRDVAHYSEEEEQERLDIGEGFPDLVGFEVLWSC
jgi:hypothetical protein